MARAPLSACRTPRFARDPLFCAAGVHVRIRTPKCKVRVLGPGVPGGGGSLLSLLARDGCSGKPHSRGKTQRFTETRRAERDDHGRLPCGLPNSAPCHKYESQRSARREGRLLPDGRHSQAGRRLQKARLASRGWRTQAPVRGCGKVAGRPLVSTMTLLRMRIRHQYSPNV